MNMKSKTCFGKTGKPVTEYRRAIDAQQEAAYISTSDRKMVAYKCQKCSKWHLSPADRQTPSVYCEDCGKKLYTTEQAARRRAEILRKEEGIQLTRYRCGNGWHLTKG